MEKAKKSSRDPLAVWIDPADSFSWSLPWIRTTFVKSPEKL